MPPRPPLADGALPKVRAEQPVEHHGGAPGAGRRAEGPLGHPVEGGDPYAKAEITAEAGAKHWPPPRRMKPTHGCANRGKTKAKDGEG